MEVSHEGNEYDWATYGYVELKPFKEHYNSYDIMELLDMTGYDTEEERFNDIRNVLEQNATKDNKKVCKIKLQEEVYKTLSEDERFEISLYLALEELFDYSGDPIPRIPDTKPPSFFVLFDLTG